MSLTKVDRHMELRRLRDSLPENDIRVKHHWMRVRYENLTHRMMMTKPSERDWQEHTLELLKRQS